MHRLPARSALGTLGSSNARLRLNRPVAQIAWLHWKIAVCDPLAREALRCTIDAGGPASPSAGLLPRTTRTVQRAQRAQTRALPNSLQTPKRHVPRPRGALDLPAGSTTTLMVRVGPTQGRGHVARSTWLFATRVAYASSINAEGPRNGGGRGQR